jgi:hypothetical protein
MHSLEGRWQMNNTHKTSTTPYSAQRFGSIFCELRSC